MNIKTVLTLCLVGFIGLCGVLIAEAAIGDWQEPQTQKEMFEVSDSDDSFGITTLTADNAEKRSINLGSIDPASSFKFQVQLSSKGAAIRKATLSEFDDRDYKDPQPLTLLWPVPSYDGREILSMANGDFVFIEQGLKLALNKLHWESSDVSTKRDGSQVVVFKALIKDADGRGVVKLNKSYRVSPDSYHLDCQLAAENLSSSQLKVRFDLQGPVGIGREGARTDMRKTVLGFVDAAGQVNGARVLAKELNKPAKLQQKLQKIRTPGTEFIWAATVNKYFAAILRPMPDTGRGPEAILSDSQLQNQPFGPVQGQTSQFDYELRKYRYSGVEIAGFCLKAKPMRLAPVGGEGSTKLLEFQLYLGPKDKSLFEKNDLYRQLGYVQTIDFLACCCPAGLIHPLAFGILALMKWMYGFIGNYGVVIIILVFLFRLIIHPITKKSQVSMSKMQKVLSDPEVQEIRKKYANKRTEMNRRILEFQKQRGVSPMSQITGMLPMMVQMPVWIALYSAIYASIELRGAPFLPFWITDLSAPDALFRFSAVRLPIFGELNSFNLLPLLLAAGMYLQQKLMPHQSASTAANPQAAQQQKMMMIMMPVMMLLFLYKAPSGLNLYIMASVFAGVIEQYVIRKHIREKETKQAQTVVLATSKTGGKVKKKKPKPFFRY